MSPLRLVNRRAGGRAGGARYPRAVRALIAFALTLGCSGAAPPADVPAPEPPPDAAPPEAEAFPFPSGSFSIKGAERVTDHCGNMRWESTAIEIDPVARTLYSTPDNRLYTIVDDGDALVARGSFDERRDRCPTDTYVELWRLEKKSDDRLTGYVTTYSHFKADDCLHACKAVFAVDVVRAEPE